MEPASQGQKPSIVTAVISGVAVIFAAVIGAVMPNLRQKAKTIDDLNVQLTQLQSTLDKRRAEYSQLRDQLGGDPALEGRRWQISGTISPAPKGRFAVYLVPGNSLSTVTDSRGHFVLDDVPAATYHVLILDEANSATDRLIEPNQPSDSFGFKNATVKWEVVDSSKKAARARGSNPYEIANSRLGHPSRSGGNP